MEAERERGGGGGTRRNEGTVRRCVFETAEAASDRSSSPEQQLHLTTSRGSGLRQIKYFKLNRGRRGFVAGGGRGGRKRAEGGEGGGGSRVGVGGFFPPYLLLSSFSPGRREFSFYNKRP